MSWFRKRPKHTQPDYRDLTDDAVEPEVPESTQAKQRAIDDLKRTRDRAPEVQRVAGSLRKLRERNRFAEQLQMIFEGGPR